MANALSVGSSPERRLPVTLRALLSPWAACVLAVALLAGARLYSHPDALLLSLGDTDDATRLYQLREFLAHGRWFDLTLPRIGAPDALVSHWSRLVDLGLAFVLSTSSLFLAPATAELAMRIVWPSLVLLALLLIVVREAARDGMPAAGHIAVGLLIMSATAFYQFQPGRIDHHNVQILCGVGGILLLAASLVHHRTGWLAGGLLGLGLLVGLESATLVAPVLVVAVLIGLGRRDGLRGQMHTAIALAVTLALGLVATTSSARLGVAVCDAAAVNLAALMSFAALGATAATYAARLGVEGPRLVALQLVSLGTLGGAGLTVYGLIEPACLAGPFGQVVREAWPIWLDRVTEGQPIGYLFARSAAETIGFVVFAMLGIAAQFHRLVMLRERMADPATLQRELVLLAAQLLGLIAACWQVKMMPYAAWLAIPALARTIAGLSAIGTLGAPTVRLAAFMVAGQSVLAAVAGGAVGLVLPRSAMADIDPLARTSCSDTPSVSTLARLSPGLVLADINLGPYLVALTPHRVVMAPYHRLDRGIVDGHRLLDGPPDAAETALRKLGVSYVIACRADGASTPPSLQEALAARRPPPYLMPVPLPAVPSLFVYRLRPAP